VPAATTHRRLLFAIALASYAIVFVCFILFEVPGLGLGHFFYIPVALLALACGTQVGFLGGALATALYALAIVVTPRVPTGDALTTATAIRFTTFSLCGILVGWFANEHRRHLEQLRDLAERDFLTGILNTRVFDEALTRRCASGQPFVLLLGDMDNLKIVNDTHGHTAGNTELRRLADALGKAIGDAAHLCTHLHDRLATEDLHMTFGWAALPEDGAAPLELFRKADDRLYAAKLVARNHRVVQQLAGARQ
jgi:GGDEF domain-containing protein